MKLVISFFVGILIGLLSCYGYFNYDLTPALFDMNRDGTSDVQYLYRQNSTLKQMRIDRNHDGKDDTVVEYDRYAIPTYEHSDDNFDGIYDTDIVYKWGLVDTIKIDTNQDGKHEVKLIYKYGVLDSIVYIDEFDNEKSSDNLSKLKINTD